MIIKAEKYYHGINNDIQTKTIYISTAHVASFEQSIFGPTNLPSIAVTMADGHHLYTLKFSEEVFDQLRFKTD